MISTARPASRRRRRSTFGAVGSAVAACVLAVATFSVPAAQAALPSDRHHHSAASPDRQAAAATLATTRYAVNRPLCGAPAAAADATCFALRRVDVAKGTPGAYRYVDSAVQHGLAGGYTPRDLAYAYGYDPRVNRSRQTVAVVDWNDDPHVLSDLQHFDDHYALPHETARSFRVVNQQGKTSPLPSPSRGSSGEITLDVQAVRAVCHTCRILLVEAEAGRPSDLAAAENTAVRLGATEVSNSYGVPDHRVSQAIQAAYNHPGVVITASTGDSGWFGWDNINANYRSDGRASYPSTDPHVVAVGGTSLRLKSNGTRADETVWNNNGADDSSGLAYGQPLGASGGGCSRTFVAAAWQRHYAGYSAAGCRGKRLAADVSALADPRTGFDVYDTYAPKSWTKKWVTVGGTSLSSPLIAAMYALARGSGGSAYPASTLYVNGTRRAPSLFDVTLGGNGFCGGDATANCTAATYQATRHETHNPNAFGAGNTDCSYPRNNSDPAKAPLMRSECNAVKGYDGPSGLGTPKSLWLFRPTNAHVSITRTTQVRAHRAAQFTAHIRAQVSHAYVTRVAWRFGDGHKIIGKSGRVHHTYKKSGSYAMSLTVTDTTGQIVVLRKLVEVSPR